MSPLPARADLDRLRALVTRRLGLRCEAGQLDQLGEVARAQLELAGTPRFEAWLERLDSAGSAELRALGRALTVNETFFFRNADNFRAITELVLPERLRARAREKRLRILSAGCSSGEEPYSLAVLVREALPDLADWDVKIVGVDLNAAVLERAAAGRYSAWSLRATPAEARRRYFRADGPDFVLDPAVRAMVTFEERNLAEEDPAFWRSLGPCDLVFCRNVLMYFTPEHTREAVRRISAALAPGGYLFLGHAETLRGTFDGLELCHTHDTFYYRRRGEGAPLGAGEPAPGPAGGGPAEHWTEVIQRSSERVATLAGGPTAPHGKARPTGAPPQEGAQPAWDLAPALEAVRQERFQDALLLLAALPPAASEDPGPLLLRAVLLTNLGRYEQSEEVCRGLLRLDPGSAGAHYLMALSREQAGDAAGAVRHGQQATAADPGFAMPHLHQGIMARRAGDAATARRELERALSLLESEAPSRLLLFGGGFSRETLVQLCRRELRAAGGVA